MQRTPATFFFTNSRMLFNLLQYKDRWGKLLNIGQRRDL